MRQRFLIAATTVALLAGSGAPPIAAQAPHIEILGERLRTALSEAARSAPGVLGAQVIDIRTGKRFGVNDTLVFPQGSAIKVAILVELFRREEAGELRLVDRLPVRKSDQVAGSGLLQRFGDGTSELSLNDLAVMMIVLSDNTATNMLIDRLGMERVNAAMAALGLPSIRLQRKMIQPKESAAGRENVATAGDAASLMVHIATCELPMSRERCASLRRMLEIPKGGPIVASVAPGTPVAWKPGGITGVSTYWGLVGLDDRPYAIAAMVNYSTDGGGTAAALQQVADAAWAYFSALDHATPHGTRVR